MLFNANGLLLSTSLGVGATSHSLHSTARDVARLKGNLLKGSSTSLKRSRDEYLTGTSPPSSSNQNGPKDAFGDEEDSRTGIIGGSLVKDNPVRPINTRLAIFEGKGKRKKKKPNHSEAQFAAPLPPRPRDAPSSSRVLSQIPSHSPSPIRQPSLTSTATSPSPISLTFPNIFDPAQPLPLSPKRPSPSHIYRDTACESPLTSSTMISSADVTETDTDDARDPEIRDTNQRSGLVQTTSSKKRKRRRKNKDKSQNPLLHAHKTGPQEELRQSE